MRKMEKKFWIILILFFASVFAADTVIRNVILKKEKHQKRENQEISYNYRLIGTKYNYVLDEINKTVVQINKEIVKRKESSDNKNIYYDYYDKKGRTVYKVKVLKDFVSAFNDNGKGGGWRERARMLPDEEGYEYDDQGNIIKKILLSASNIMTTSYDIVHEKDLEKITILKGCQRVSYKEIYKYKYDKNNQKIEEIYRTINPISFKEIKKEYKKEKVVNETTIIEENKPIIVEITKEYDKNEKLIKKFVLRKNRLNAIRSETNFDFIKGEIVTKYYDGEKVFATVTETLIGKDRAIVKRERVGDEFVIWDDYELKISNNNNPINFYTRIVVYKNNQIKYYYENYKESTVWKFNDGKNGITKDSYRKEHLLTKNIDLDEGLSLYLSKEFYEIEYNNGSINKIYLKKYKANPKLAKNLWDKDLINDMPDESYKQEIQKYLVIEEIKDNRIEDRLNKMKNIILGGNGNGY